MRKKIGRADELPTHGYQLSGSVSAALNDDTAFDHLAREVVKDIEADLQEYDIADHATLRKYYKTLLHFSMLEHRFHDAEDCIRHIKQVEDKDGQRLTCGVVEKAIIAARIAPSDGMAAFSSTLKTQLSALPFHMVQVELTAQNRRLEILSRELYLGVVEEQLDPTAATGTVSIDVACRAIEIKYFLECILRFKDAAVEILTGIIAANRQHKPDIWETREVSFREGESLETVVVAIWDTGTDISLFPDRVCQTNSGEPLTIGWSSTTGEPVPGPLREIVLPQERFMEAKHFTKGSNDMSGNIDSLEASALRKHLAQLRKDHVRPFLEGLSFYEEYSHGTHVAGIAARGNPAIRLLVARIDWPYEMIPPAPTQEWADRYADNLCRTVAYFKRYGVRLVNISWGENPRQIEQNLEVNSQGGSPQERRELARTLFERIKKTLGQAIAAAPEILFVAAAGNANADVLFDDEIPSSFDFSNVISVGAVDNAGDETFFTRIGKIDVYACGYLVESLVPGGDRQMWSGTSMSAPNVVNLAAKLLAKYPSLTTTQLKTLILDGTSPKVTAQNREIRLLNPRQSFELAAAEVSPGR